jgi:flagellin
MSFSIQTNVNSLVARENLNINSQFQSQTIQRLTSGYRINSAGDDAAGLAVANKFRSDTAELTQGVQNANDGVAQLQIIDGGLSQISQMLDRLKTLATESASDTFTGNRTTLNSEYQTVLLEISRQAGNIGLTSGGTFNNNLKVYIGGAGSNTTNAQVAVNLSGAANQVDAAGLGLSGTNIAAAGTGLNATNVVLLNNASGNFYGSQNFTFYLQGQSGSTVVAYNGAGVATGDSTTALSKLNAAIQAAGINGITASMGSDGKLQFSSGMGFSVVAGAGANGMATATAKADYNKGLYTYQGAAPSVSSVTGSDELDTITNAQGSVNLDFNVANGGSLVNALAYLNTKLNSIGIYAVADSANSGFTLQGASTFTINETAAATTGSVFGGVTGAVALTNAAPTSAGASATAAIQQIETAVGNLGLVQGRVGAGENQLKYALNLATSQISNYSAAEAGIRDADVASEAANLTKAQVLQQASIAAMAQANSAPQAILALLRT